MRIPDFAAQDETQSFSAGLYQEHLEEASFLYEQRISLLNNPEITWKKIGEFEERFEAHIDGLVVGGDLALKLCAAHAKEDDFGELHAAVRVFCRQNRKDLLSAVLNEVDLQDDAKIQAVGDALRDDLPAAWFADLWLLGRTNPLLIPLLVRVAAYRGDDVRELGRVLQETHPQFRPDVIWAFGRLRQRAVCDELRTYLDHKDPVVQSEAATALLRLGDDLTLDYCLRRVASSSWPAVPLGLAGSRSAVRAFLAEARNHPLNYDQVLALGLLGDISSVPLLLSALNGPETAEAAAVSLQLITGANHAETVFLPEPIDEDELFDEEREKVGTGQVRRRPDGKPFGRTVTRLSQKLEDWHEWWSEHASGFEPHVRYRNGQPYSPQCLIEVLKSELSPHIVRKLAYDELVIRHQMDVRFETDMFVGRQTQAIGAIEAWVERNKDRVREGCFYFADRLSFD